MSKFLPMMSAAEVAFLERNLTPGDRVWEWGSGASSLWLATRVRELTTVEHDPRFAFGLIKMLADEVVKQTSHVSVLYVPPNGHWDNDSPDDGDLSSFRGYIECFSGRGIDVVVIDGRARVEAARFVAERAPFGPHPDMRIFLHDCQRPEYGEIWQDTEGHNEETPEGPVWVPKRRGLFSLVERVDNLALLQMRLDP